MNFPRRKKPTPKDGQDPVAETGASLAVPMTPLNAVLCVGDAMAIRGEARGEIASLARQVDASYETWASMWGEDEESEVLGYELMQDGTAVVRIEGPIIGRSVWWSRYSRCACTPDIVAALDRGMIDPRVKRFLLYIDTPGGAVSGVTALADKIFGMRTGAKTVDAHIAGQGCSCGYWLATQARRITCRPDSLVSCVGVIQWLSSWAGYNQEHGISYEPIISDAAKEFKAAGDPDIPVTDAHRAYIGEMVNDFAALFISAVARGLGISESEVLADGKAYVGTRALSLKLIDGFASYEEALTWATRAENAPRPIVNPTTDPAPAPDEEDSNSMEITETEATGLKALLKKLGFGGAAAPGVSPTTTTPPPAAPAAPVAQTPAEAFFQRELASAHSAALAAATKRFGQGTDELVKASTTLESLKTSGSIDALRDMEAVHTAAAPSVLGGGQQDATAGRQTVATQPTGVPGSAAAAPPAGSAKTGGSWGDYSKQAKGA
jgi:ClpP class serine protease